MSGTSSPLADLLANCDAHGIRLLVADDGGLTIDAPREALTPDLLERLKARKGELLKLLQQASGFDVDNVPDAEPASIITRSNTMTVCRCGSTTWRDVSIHNGQSVRRDCGRCGRYIAFPMWYGNCTLHNEQYSIG